MTSDDTNLHKQFQALRERDHAGAPAFESMVAHAAVRKPTGRGVPFWTAGGLALAASVALLLVLQRPATTLDATALGLPAWQSPTDFLLAGPDPSLRSLSWTPSPTSGLGQPFFNSKWENR